jgi:hypothetical protein
MSNSTQVCKLCNHLIAYIQFTVIFGLDLQAENAIKEVAVYACCTGVAGPFDA